MAETALSLARKAASFLGEQGFDNARLDAELLLAGVLGLRRLDLYLQYDRPIDAHELAEFRAAIRRRLRHEPIQYILGEAHFRKLVLHVDARVLIPRPETEVLVGAVLAWLREWQGDGVECWGVDVGTGSGAIALSLMAEGGVTGMVATDVSADALAVAEGNARRLGLAGRIEFRVGPLLEPLAAQERYAVIVSNPPYVEESARAGLPPEVRDWEPGQALYGGGDGLQFLDLLVDGAPAHLQPGGLLALEVGLGQAEVVAKRMRATLQQVRIINDLTDRPRVVLGETRRG